MDFSAATDRIAAIVVTVYKFKKKIESIYNKFANKINGYIDELEKVLEKLVELGVKAIAWIEMQIYKILKKITDALDAVKQAINNVLQQVKDWYNDTVNRFKVSIIKSVMAKLGIACSDEQAESMTGMIPHPAVDGLLPEIKIELPLPNVTDVRFLENYKIELKKLPILDI
jgi:hypothetical protein